MGSRILKLVKLLIRVSGLALEDSISLIIEMSRSLLVVAVPFAAGYGPQSAELGYQFLLVLAYQGAIV